MFLLQALIVLKGIWVTDIPVPDTMVKISNIEFINLPLFDSSQLRTEHR